MFWLIADTHLGHQRMEKLCGRPKKFEGLILANLAAALAPEDVLIHLGDVSFYDHEKWHQRLLAACFCKQKWLIRGNHDEEPDDWYKLQGWDVVVDEQLIDINNGKFVLLTHKPVKILDEAIVLNIHGHLHNNQHHKDMKELTDKHVLIKCEHEYKPVLLNDVIRGIL